MPAKSKKNTGFQSAAGLIRYFDNEVEKGPVLKPWFVVGSIIALVAIVSLAKFIWPV
ncbi:MAG: preprotein translocase subunit Sec61beta [Methanomassiliicoccus sp.]|mgnify:CR=1 FL=1|jgi:preprotein translocase subunit Sec61beta|nr:preprotein translocase subunit Sec61beta [Methanomassiliicoccus sp.]